MSRNKNKVEETIEDSASAEAMHQESQISESNDELNSLEPAHNEQASEETLLDSGSNEEVSEEALEAESEEAPSESESCSADVAHADMGEPISEESEETSSPLNLEDLTEDEQAEILKKAVEALLLASSKPLTLNKIRHLLYGVTPTNEKIKEALDTLSEECEERGVMLSKVATGYTYRIRPELGPFIQKLWEEKPPKYTKATLETLAIIVYRQPVTRGEIESIRGVAVSSNIIKGLVEREWIKVVGHKDVPGKPAIYATTKEFLDYFNMKSINDFPELAPAADLDEQAANLEEQLTLALSESPIEESADASENMESSAVENEQESTGDDAELEPAEQEEQQDMEAEAHEGEVASTDEMDEALPDVVSEIIDQMEEDIMLGAEVEESA